MSLKSIWKEHAEIAKAVHDQVTKQSIRFIHWRLIEFETSAETWSHHGQGGVPACSVDALSNASVWHTYNAMKFDPAIEKPCKQCFALYQKYGVGLKI